MGTGLSDDELAAVVAKLKPYFRYGVLAWVIRMFKHKTEFYYFNKSTVVYFENASLWLTYTVDTTQLWTNICFTYL